MTRLVFEHDQTHIRSPFHDGCTNIPLAAGKAQERRDHSSNRPFKAMRYYGSSTWIRQDLLRSWMMEFE
jgi:hypothetical protein